MGNSNALIKETVTSVIPGAEVILFGSRAKGTAKAHSDYDLLVITPHQLNKAVYVKTYSFLMNTFAELLDEQVDLIIKSKEAADAERDRINYVVHEAFQYGLKL